MKIQCACGTKYSFDITPEMAKAPIKLVCQNCGVDNSAAVNQVIQQQYGAVSSGQTGGPLTAPQPDIVPPAPGTRIIPAATAAAPRVPAVAAPALRIGVSPSSPPASSAPADNTPGIELCARHSNQPVTNRCRVCEKPMCPKCMEIFGFVCSAYCKGNAENQGIDLPRFAGQRALVEASQTKWIGRALGGAFALFFLTMAAWGWYAWVGSVPKVAASLKLAESGSSGQLHIVGKNQAVFLHRGKLTRHDLKENREIWSTTLLDEERIVAESKATYEKFVAEREQMLRSGGELNGELGTLEEMIEDNKMYAASQLHLHARGEVVWISSMDKITQFDWSSGKPTQDIPLAPGERRLVANGDELIAGVANSAVIHVNLLTGETRTDRVPGSESVPSKASSLASGNTGKSGSSADPARSRNLSLQERVVNPALAAASANQQRLAAEMRGASTQPGASSNAMDPSAFQLIVTRHGSFQFSRRQIGTRLVDGETVNMHQATWRRMGAGGPVEWSGEVPGYPELHGLNTVDVLIAGKTAMVFDKTSKKIWETRIEGEVRGPSNESFQPDESPTGEGPCVEHDGTLYICNTLGISAFDITTGDRHWKLDSPQINGLVFDDKGGIYANSSTSFGDKAYALVQKINSKTGEVTWHVEREGAVGYASDNFVYAVESYKGDTDESDGLPGMKTIFHVSPYISIKRLDPANGRILWHHFQQRFPLDVHFDKNSFNFLFKKEVQVLKFISL